MAQCCVCHVNEFIRRNCCSTKRELIMEPVRRVCHFVSLCLTQQSGVTPVGRASCVTAFQTPCLFNSRGTWPDSPGSQCSALRGLLIYETLHSHACSLLTPVAQRLRLGVEWGKGTMLLMIGMTGMV